MKAKPRPALLLRQADVSLQTRSPSLSQKGSVKLDPGQPHETWRQEAWLTKLWTSTWKATGRDGTQKREELVNMRPGELRRSLERWQARAKEMQRLQDKKEHAWDLHSRVPNFRLKNKENFEKDFKHRAVYDGKGDVGEAAEMD